ncbi:MAG: hypothetical protein AABW75_00150 [Nanoarchaeota archaeon]
MKALIFDSGTLINLSMNGLLYLVEMLKKNFNGKFLITSDVKGEVIDRPKGIPRFELGALSIESLLNSRVIEMPEALGISSNDLEGKTKELLGKANHFIKVDGEWISLVSSAEMSCLALSLELTEKSIENVISIDERTTRVLCEDPRQLERMMSEKLHKKVNIEGDIKPFLNFRFIRSSEVVFVAFKEGFVNIKGNKVLEALLYATKYKGCAISFEEIEELKRL